MTANVQAVGRSLLLTTVCGWREETLSCPVQVALLPPTSGSRCPLPSA